MSNLRRFGTVAFDLDVMLRLIGVGWIETREDGAQRIVKPWEIHEADQALQGMDPSSERYAKAFAALAQTKRQIGGIRRGASGLHTWPWLAVVPEHLRPIAQSAVARVVQQWVGHAVGEPQERELVLQIQAECLRELERSAERPPAARYVLTLDSGKPAETKPERDH